MFSELTIRYAAFGPAERAVIDAYKLRPIFEGTFWLPSTGPTREKGWIEARMGITNIEEFSDGLVELLSREADVEHLVLEEVGNKGGSTTVNAKKLTLIIREPAGPSLTVKQMSEVLGAIESLYAVVSRVNGLASSELVVGVLDSGSDKSVDVIGIADGISKLSELILQAWDRVRYSKSLKFSASVKSASDGLALLEQINSAVEKKSIAPEEGEKLRRNVFKGVDDLFSNGAFIPEMEQQRPLLPSQIPLERRKLIAHQAPVVSDPKPAAPDEDVDADPFEE